MRRDKYIIFEFDSASINDALEEVYQSLAELDIKERVIVYSKFKVPKNTREYDKDYYEYLMGSGVRAKIKVYVFPPDS